MKKIVYTVFALAISALTGCTDTTKYETEAPQIGAVISISSPKVIFDANGGEKNVIVTANTAWTYEIRAPWATVTRNEDVLTIKASQNKADQILTSVITIIALKGGTAAEKTITLLQAGYAVQNLSTNGTSNCYIASTETSYMFEASVKGNGNEKGDGTTEYIAACGLNIDPGKAAYADLVWESTFVFNRSSCSEVIEGQPVYNNGFIFFKTGTYEGNALIALKDNAGNILWSWHIWVCDDIFEDSPVNGFAFMDRNLGALNNAPDDVNNRGLFYQWGRKDPFLPSGSEYGAASYLQNEQVGDGSGSWTYEGQAPQPMTVHPGNISLTVKNPMLFYSSFTNGVYSWYGSVKNSVTCNNYLWGRESDAGTKKSIFDPCPVGYRMPPLKAYGDVNLTETEYAQAWAANGRYGSDWIGGNGDYFPFAGEILIFTGVGETGVRSYYWTNTPVPDNVYSSVLMMASGRISLFQAGHVYGCNVRCIKE